MAGVNVKQQDAVGERLYETTLASGLKVAVLPRPGFQKAFATFATHYGSIDNAFEVPGEHRVVEVPDGIAHFLEHKMFEKADGGDVFDDFARFGASANAYTDYTSTTFLFSATSHLEENLDILLDFLQNPHFTEANVTKEKGIIEQEIRMYLDMPADRLHSNLMEALYHRNPVRIDVAGTVESIRTITPDDLYLCHRTFYHPSNMVVFVTGGVDPEAVLAQIEENQAKRTVPPQAAIHRVYPDEPPEIRERRVEQTMPVAAPLFMMGYKDPHVGLSGRELLRREVVAGFLWNILVGRSSEFFSRLYESGLINSRFQAHYGAGATFGFSTLAGETPDPERLEAELVQHLATLPIEGEDLARQKRRELGEYVALFQNLEEIAYVYNHFVFQDIDLFDLPAVVESVRVDDLEAFRAEHLTESRRSVSIIRPARP